MTVANVADLILYLGGLAGAVITIGTLLHVVAVRPLRRKVAEEIDQHVSKQLGEIKAEVTPNSGRSMRDAVTRTEAKVELLTSRFDAHLVNHPRP